MTSPKPSPPAPLAVAALAFAGGIWLAGHLAREPQTWGITSVVLVVCALTAIFVKSLRLAQVCALLALAGSGAFARTYTPVPRVLVTPMEFLSGEPVEITGHVTSDGAGLPGTGLREGFERQTEAMRGKGGTFTHPD